MKKIPDVIIADFDKWTIMVVSKDGEIPAQCQHYIRYVWNYLMYGRGLFKNRFTSVATRLFARTLKPSQVFFSN
jgi:hypothetical protein